MNIYLDKIFGQPKVKNILSGFIESTKIPHALLFSGNEGVGKDAAAIRFAQALNKSSDPIILNKIEQLSEPFIKFIIPLPRGKNETESNNATEKLGIDEIELLHQELSLKIQNPYHKIILPKANYIRINSIREINKFISLDFTDLKYRVIIISQAHFMNEEAQNALLKNLEEPPDNVIFILTTAYPSRLRETVRSRCWKVNFDPLRETEVVEILSKYFHQPEDLSIAVAPFANGSVTTALELTKLDFINLKEKIISVLRYSLARRYNSAFEELNSIFSEQKPENIQLIVKMILTWLNDLYKYRSGMDVFFYNNHIETLKKFNARYPDTNLLEAVRNIDKLSTIVKNNVNQNLISANLILEVSAITASNN